MISARRVLVIEAERAHRQFLTPASSQPAPTAGEAATGASGLRLAAESPPGVVILDLDLPGTNGRAVPARLREWSDAPVVILFGPRSGT